jgi:hypothetical protein
MSFIFFLGWAQKIATAIYLISGLLSEREPLRESFRKNALELLSDMRTFSESAVVNEHQLARVRSVLEHTLSLLDVGARAGHISSMNSTFLKTEAESFMRDLTASLEDKEALTPIERSLKDSEAVAENPLFLQEARISYKGHDKGHHKGHVVIHTKTTPSPVFGEFKQMKGPIKDIFPATPTSADRKEKIYQIIKSKGSLTIKDIAGVAPEYSEKTIQRDLVDMVESGRLKKKGERRWTVYFV